MTLAAFFEKALDHDDASFLYETDSRFSREKLLEFLAEHPDIEKLKTLSKEELMRIYCRARAARMARASRA